MGVHENRESGSVTFTGTDLVKTVTVPAYIASKTILSFNYRGGGSDEDSSFLEAIKKSPTEIEFRRNAHTSDVDLTVEWEMNSFSSRLAVQDFTVTGPGTTAIAVVALANAYIISLGVQSSGTFTMGGETYLELAFNSATEVAHTLGTGTDSIVSATFQVIEDLDADVQTISSDMDAVTDTKNHTIDAVVAGKTCLFGTCQADGVRSLGDYPGLKLTTPTNVRAKRRLTAGVVNYTIFAVEFTNGTTVQQNETLDLTDDVANYTLSPAIDEDKSMSCLACCTPWQVVGRSASSDRNTQNAFYTSVLTTDIINQIESSFSNSTQDPVSQVIEWDDTPPVMSFPVPGRRAFSVGRTGMGF